MNINAKLRELAIKAWKAYAGEIDLPKDEWIDFALSPKQQQYIKLKTGVDVSGYKRVISIYDILHTFNNHADRAKEARRNQIPITPSDIEKIPEILVNAEIIGFSTTRSGLDAIEYRAEHSGIIIYIEEIRTGRKKLALRTLYKKK